jgi:two-component system sensor histidine kinase/response regulator
VIKEMRSFHKNRILVADDEEFCLTTTKTILEKLGIDVMRRVDFCMSGAEAVNNVSEAYEMNLRYSIILIDFSMPVMDGLEATTEIRRKLTEEYGIPREN